MRTGLPIRGQLHMRNQKWCPRTHSVGQVRNLNSHQLAPFSPYHWLHHTHTLPTLSSSQTWFCSIFRQARLLLIMHDALRQLGLRILLAGKLCMVLLWLTASPDCWFTSLGSTAKSGCSWPRLRVCLCYIKQWLTHTVEAVWILESCVR